LSEKTIVTPVLAYWGFRKHPFADFVLRGAELELFVDRATELRRLHNALSSRLCGAFGAQGIGKSSLLENLRQKVEEAGYRVVLVQMTGTSENLLHREILASLLEKIKDKTIKLDSSLKLRIDEEVQRIQSSIKHVSETETGVGVRFVAETGTSVSEADEHELPQHTEESALALAARIVEHAKQPFVVIIDNLERARSLIETEEGYFRFVTRFARVIDERMPNSGISFVVSLDRSFVERIESQLPDVEEAYSFCFGALVSVDPFTPSDMWAIIERRLMQRGWKRATSAFVTPDALWSLVITTEGHPRRAFAVLREAMELIAADGAEEQITLEYVRRAAANCREAVDETNLRILEFLSDGKSHSPSEDGFSESVGVALTTLRPRLAELGENGLLSAERVQEGRVRKLLYSLPSLGLPDSG
jgi:hypothetical protein